MLSSTLKAVIAVNMKNYPMGDIHRISRQTYDKTIYIISLKCSLHENFYIHILLLFILSTWATLWQQGSNRIQSLAAKGTLKHCATWVVIDTEHEGICSHLTKASYRYYILRLVCFVIFIMEIQNFLYTDLTWGLTYWRVYSSLQCAL